MQTIQDVPMLLRREIEALMLKPFLDAFSEEFGRERTLEIAARVVSEIAEAGGEAYAKKLGANDLPAISQQVKDWGAGDALKTRPLSEEAASSCDYGFDVTECAYAKMYERIGMKELGTLLSCGRDEPFYKGFNPKIRFDRTKTLMEGCGCCDFRFCMKKKEG